MWKVTDECTPEEIIKGLNPWTRKWKISEYEGAFVVTVDSFWDSFKDACEANRGIDADFKKAILKVSAAVVSLASHTGGEKALFIGSGTIIKCEKNTHGSYSSIILTSASIFGLSTTPQPGNSIQVDVFLPEGKLNHCQDFNFDFHYNVATLKIYTDNPLHAAILRLVNPNEISSHRGQGVEFQYTFPLCPGDMVIAIGRYFCEPNNIMAAPGPFSLDCCPFDCKELLRVNCKISKCGIGGPMINCYGEVIGMNFYDQLSTPFLPINLIVRCLDHFKQHGLFFRPWLGLEATNLYTASIKKLEKVIQKFPHISKAVIVEEVVSGPPSDLAGILIDDIIVQCARQNILSFLEFLESVWDKVGKSLEVVVIRGGVTLTLAMDVLDTPMDKLSSWPIPEESKSFVKRLIW